MAYELTHIKGNSWFFQAPVNIGLYEHSGEVFLIDSGNDESAARKILRAIDEKKWSLSMIINTHSHADHIGGNSFLQKRTGCRIAASAKESAFISDPSLEPFYLWSSAAPKEIRNKFLQASPSKVTDIIEPDRLIEGSPLKAIDISGHSLGMIGLETPDRVFFIADSVISPAILRKYGTPYCADIASAFKTLELLEKYDAEFFAPSHGEIVKSLDDYISSNRETLNQIRDIFLRECTAPKTREQLLSIVAGFYSLRINLTQYVLIHSTISAMLSWMIDIGELKCQFENAIPRWESLKR